MFEVLENLPWIDRLVIVGLATTAGFAPWLISERLGHIAKQNERIINLLVDIKIGKRDLP